MNLAQNSTEHVRQNKRGNILCDSSGMARANRATIGPRKNTPYKRGRQFRDMLRRTNESRSGIARILWANTKRKYLLTRRTKSEILGPCFEVGYVPYVVPLAGEIFRSTAHRITNHCISLSRLP